MANYIFPTRAAGPLQIESYSLHLQNTTIQFLFFQTDVSPFPAASVPETAEPNPAQTGFQESTGQLRGSLLAVGTGT
jgi:hypothetical protein